MYELNLKEELNTLFNLYSTGNAEIKNECIDKLYILMYYHPKYFGILLKKDELSDFLSLLYPEKINNMFIKYKKEKSNFFTFIYSCLKYQVQFFLKKNRQKNIITEIVLEEVKQETNINQVENENFESYNKDNLCEEIPNSYENIQNELNSWLLKNKVKKGNKNYKRTVFIISCKVAAFLDEQMIFNIAKYINMPPYLLRYYIAKLNTEYMNINKSITEIKNQKAKYFLRKLHCEKMLNNEYISEYLKDTLQKSNKYSIKHYENACKKLKTKVKNISNRTISKITGIPRCTIDRILLEAKNILKEIKIDTLF